ncbi:zinc ribbon domain-containing protein [Acetoanaerobium noterae]|uniref:zinc ribbon domain-containing protein n=1 Tax=Acetoanaerobium noterae TaxID=745369 RepID=UPI0028B1A65D|nr:zinc ribbon domain-containing protein [Acetoanaerobium noterae]
MFCRYCGTKIPDTAKFCKNCGKATSKQAKSNEQFTNQDSENKENQNNVKISESKVLHETLNQREDLNEKEKLNEIKKQKTYEKINDYKPKINDSKEISPKKTGGFFKIFAPIISIALIGLLLNYFIGPFNIPKMDDFSLSKKTIETNEKPQVLPKVEYSASELKAEPMKAVVSTENPMANLEGVIVDFGEFNLSEEKSLEIVSLPSKIDEVAGVEFQAYDFNLEDIKEFNTLVDITLKYNPEGLTEEEQAKAITIAWFDESIEQWIPILSSVDTENKTVTFSTEHFSMFSILKNTTNKGKSVFYYPNNEYKGVTTPVLVDSGALIDMLDKVDTKPFELLLRDRSVPTNEVVSTGANYLNIITGSADQLEALSNALLPSIMRVGESVSNRFAGLGIAAVSLKISNQLSRGVPLNTVLRDNAFNILEIALIVAVSVKASPFIAAAATAVWIGGIVDELTYDPEDITSYLDDVERVYDYFSMEQVTYNFDTKSCGYIIPVPGKKIELRENEYMLSTQADWARVLSKIRKDNLESPHLIKEEVNKVVESYSSAFWRAYAKDMAGVFYWIDGRALLRSNQLADTLEWPKTNEKLQKYAQRTIVRTHDRLQTVYNEMAKVENHQLGVKYTLAAMDLAESLNQTVYFEAIDPNLEKPGFAKSVHASKYFELESNGFHQEDFVASERHQDSNIIFRCNLYHYILAGSPNQLAIYPFAPSETAMPVRDGYIGFNFSLPNTKIEFPSEIQQGEILGHWSIYSNYSNNGVFIPPGLSEEGQENFKKEHGIVGEPERRGFKMVFYPDNTFYCEIRSEDSIIDSSFSGTYKTMEYEGANKGTYYYLADIDESTIINKGQMVYRNVGEGPDLKFYFSEKDGKKLLFEETTQTYLE